MTHFPGYTNNFYSESIIPRTIRPAFIFTEDDWPRISWVCTRDFGSFWRDSHDFIRFLMSEWSGISQARRSPIHLSLGRFAANRSRETKVK